MKSILMCLVALGFVLLSKRVEGVESYMILIMGQIWLVGSLVAGR